MEPHSDDNGSSVDTAETRSCVQKETRRSRCVRLRLVGPFQLRPALGEVELFLMEQCIAGDDHWHLQNLL